MPRTKISSLRLLAYRSQNGLCYYCERPMWFADAKDFRRRYNLTRAEARALRCTAEHLRARCDGGSDEAANIAAACLHCNQARHRKPKSAPDPATHRRIVKDLHGAAWGIVLRDSC
jgi:hypothetical protein